MASWPESGAVVPAGLTGSAGAGLVGGRGARAACATGSRPAPTPSCPASPARRATPPSGTPPSRTPPARSRARVPPVQVGDRALVDDAARRAGRRRDRGSAQHLGHPTGPGGARGGGEVGEVAPRGGHEVGVGVGQGEHAAPADLGAQGVEPLRRRGRGAPGHGSGSTCAGAHLVPPGHRGRGLEEVGVDRHADRASGRRARGRRAGQGVDQAGEAPAGSERGREVVVGEQRRRPRHHRQAARPVGDRVEHRHGGGAYRVRDGGGRGPREADHRKEQADRADPRRPGRAEAPVGVEQQRVDAGRGDGQRRRRRPVSGTRRVNGTSSPGSSTSTISVKAGRTSSAGSVPFRLARVSREPVTGVPRCRRTPRSRTGTAERLATRPVTMSSGGPSPVTIRGVSPSRRTETGASSAAAVGRPVARQAGGRRGERGRGREAERAREQRDEQPEPRRRGSVTRRSWSTPRRGEPSRRLLQDLRRPPHQPALVGVGQPAASSASGTQATSVTSTSASDSSPPSGRAAGSGARSCGSAGPRRRTSSRCVPSGAGRRPMMPVSSSTSRTAACSAVSPSSMWPLGSDQSSRPRRSRRPIRAAHARGRCRRPGRLPRSRRPCAAAPGPRRRRSAGRRRGVDMSRSVRGRRTRHAVRRVRRSGRRRACARHAEGAACRC